MLLAVARDVWGKHPEELSARQRSLALEYIALKEIEDESRSPVEDLL